VGCRTDWARSSHRLLALSLRVLEAKLATITLPG